MASNICLIHARYTYLSFLTSFMFQNLCLVKIWFGSSTIRSSIQRKHSNAFFFLEVTAFHVIRLWIKFIFEWQRLYQTNFTLIRFWIIYPNNSRGQTFLTPIVIHKKVIWFTQQAYDFLQVWNRNNLFSDPFCTTPLQNFFMD